MDLALSGTMLQSSEVDTDTIMQGNELRYSANANVQNGFMDPRELHPFQSNDLTESTEDHSPSQSQRTTETTTTSNALRRLLLPTGCCYDDRMKYHANADFSANPHHPEDPRRIEAIMREFRDAGLIYEGSDSDLDNILKISPTRYMARIQAREAREDEICTAHTASHYEWVRSLSYKSPAELRAMTITFDEGRKSLYVGTLTHYAALISAGGAIETCKNVVEGRVKNAIAVIRPPGHHAEHNESMGFCIFNNVPIAAKVCMQDYPDVCRKVLILDWDVHHGNGIQNIFYEDPNVLYISLHVYQNGQFYPGQPEDEGLPDGGPENCGAGLGVGRNVNIGWHEQGMGDGEYMAAFQKIVMPIAQEFDPDLVIISAGFDAAAGDELGGCYVSPACYSHMTHMLMSLANGKLAVCLEGGYNLRAISRSALAVAKTLMGEPPERMESIPPLNKKAARDLEHVRAYQSAYWDCMRPGIVPIREMEDRNASRLSEVVRAYAKKILSEKHNMITMPILRNKICKSFDNQVLVTPMIHQARKIMLIVHDPPEIVAQADSLDNSVLPHNAWVVNDLLPYVDWAIANGFGVIDINFPREIKPTDNQPYLPNSTEVDIQQLSKDLLSYLWDNHLQLNISAPIVLLGVGDAYLGIKQLLTSRDVKARIPCVLSYVTGSLRPVKSETDPNLSSWYKQNSLIYVSSDHSCWNDEDNAKRVRKNRFGAVKKSEVTGLGRMLKKYEKEAESWVLEKVNDWESIYGGDPDETEEEELTAGSSTRGLPEESSTGTRMLVDGRAGGIP
ncbi:Arginase [Venustampulla echinocandica]|uniref:Histone deacetylase n=1 Tax=Venustampulla echinocandica TaxID=2656787 RepID=A0A370TGE3_9HELO|nr:Arginase [Venustampulla echinocandica]RDL33974.1 Arginase [Venustampulla echinocandica]